MLPKNKNKWDSILLQLLRKNLIILMIDGGRLDFANQSLLYKKIKKDAICLSQPITYGPHTIAAMHAVFSGTYGNRTGTNSYWSTYQFNKEKFKIISEYLHDEGYYTCADIVSDLVIPKQGLDEFKIHDEINDNLTTNHIEYIKQCHLSFVCWQENASPCVILISQI